MSLARPTPLLLALAAVLAVLAFPAFPAFPAHAQAADKIDVQVLVAQVSTKGTDVAPELKGMAADLKRSGFAFTSFKLLDKKPLALKLKAAGTVKLPNGLARLTLVKLEGAKATVEFETPGTAARPLKSTQTMTPGGETYVGAGDHADGKIFLAVKR